MTMTYDGGLTCSLAVKDFDKAAAWYTEVLGFKLLYKLEDMGWGEFETAVSRVNIGLSQTEEGGGKGGATLVFGVKDIETAKAHLAKHQVRFNGDIQTIPGMVKLQTFFDPDGNALMLYEDLKT